MDTWIDDEIRSREEEMIRETLAALKRPSEVQDIQIEFGEDHSGNPAVWIKLSVTNSVRPRSPAWNDVFEYSQEIGQALSEKRLRHWPYVRFHSMAQATN